MTSKIVRCAYCLPFFLITVSLAQAQQPGKVPPIGYLGGGPASGPAVRVEVFRQGMTQAGMDGGKKHHRRVSIRGGKSRAQA